MKLVLVAALAAALAFVGDDFEKPASPSGRPMAGILLFPGVQIIDYTGPYEVLGQAGFDVVTVAERREPLRTAMGMTVIPTFALEEAPVVDVLVVPGGNVDAVLERPAALDWVRRASARSRYTLSVCNGAFILARAGLLDGLSATTFHRLIEELREEAPHTRVVSDRRVVDNGRIVTAAGLSAGLDGALRIVEKVHGRARAESVAANMEYEWRKDLSLEVSDPKRLSPPSPPAPSAAR